jgi:hypothetical protein
MQKFLVDTAKADDRCRSHVRPAEPYPAAAD